MVNVGFIEPIVPSQGEVYTNLIELLGKKSYNDFSPSQLVKNDNQRSKDLTLKYGEKYDIDPDLLHAVIEKESNHNPKAVNKYSKAKGLMQLMDGTSAEIAQELGYTEYDIFNPETNIEFGAYYLSKQLKAFKGNVSLALAAYNAGPANVRKYNGIPPFKETQNYVKAITDKYNIRKETKNDMEKKGLREYNINNQFVILHPDLARKVLQANDMMIQEKGKGLNITSHYRTTSQQTELYNQYKQGKIGKAAPPGKSNHEYGKAVDIANWEEAQPYLHRVGLINSIPNDKVHFSINGR